MIRIDFVLGTAGIYSGVWFTWRNGPYFDDYFLLISVVLSCVLLKIGFFGFIRLAVGVFAVFVMWLVGIVKCFVLVSVVGAALVLRSHVIFFLIRERDF